jgi:hypothetical protein
MVRPDWHVYGTAASGEELSALLRKLNASLRSAMPNRTETDDGHTIEFASRQH